VPRAVLDTSVLIGEQPISAELEAAISTVSIAELHFGLLVAGDGRTRALRAARLGLIEARFPDPLSCRLLAREAAEPRLDDHLRLNNDPRLGSI
jgi:predicted nucleic acid-binding protein